jgi:flagellar basal body-associated protein FliL
MENQSAQLSPRDKGYKLMTMILGAVIALCLALSLAIALLSGAGRLHPVKNDAQIQNENYQETEAEYSEVSNMVEGFTARR